MKFGGTSVGSADRIKVVADIIKLNLDKKPVVVCSAVGGITDRLIALCTKDYFTNDLKYLIVRSIFNGNKQKFNKMMMNPEIVKMTMK